VHTEIVEWVEVNDFGGVAIVLLILLDLELLVGAVDVDFASAVFGLERLEVQEND